MRGIILEVQLTQHSLGLSHDYHKVGSWIKNGSTLTITCPWSLVQPVEKTPPTAVGLQHPFPVSSTGCKAALVQWEVLQRPQWSQTPSYICRYYACLSRHLELAQRFLYFVNNSPPTRHTIANQRQRVSLLTATPDASVWVCWSIEFHKVPTRQVVAHFYICKRCMNYVSHLIKYYGSTSRILQHNILVSRVTY